jgi:ABC-type lipoprotein export system ATPase subunit/ABC-type antimicrobial peptide transport system permease subunit
LLHLRNISKTFNPGKKNEYKALKGVNLSFEDKGFVFIVGKSGSGKSTLLNIIGMLAPPDADGFLEVNGKTTFNTLEQDSYRNTYIGIIFQEFNLLDGFTVRENIALGREISRATLSEDELKSVLAEVKLEDLEDRDIGELSGGQKQRVAIARTLVKNPQIVLADEPTGNLDKKNAKIIFDILQELAKTKLVIVITHDMECAEEYAERVIRVQDGEIVADGYRDPFYSEDTVFEASRVLISKNSAPTEEFAACVSQRGARQVVFSEREKFRPKTEIKREIDLCESEDFDPSVLTLQERTEDDGKEYLSPNTYVNGASASGNSAEGFVATKTVLPNKTIVKLAFFKIKASKTKFAVSLILIILSIALFGAASLLGSYKYSEVSTDMFAKYQERGFLIQEAVPVGPFGFLSRTSVKLDEADVQKTVGSDIKLEPFYDLNGLVFRFNEISAPKTQSGSIKENSQLRFLGLYETDSKEGLINYGQGAGYTLLSGVFPAKAERREVVTANGSIWAMPVCITDYTAYLIANYGAYDADDNSLLRPVNSSEPLDDYIKKMTGKTVKLGFNRSMPAEILYISGIIDTDYETLLPYIEMPLDVSWSLTSLTNIEGYYLAGGRTRNEGYYAALYGQVGTHNLIGDFGVARYDDEIFITESYIKEAIEIKTAEIVALTGSTSKAPFIKYSSYKDENEPLKDDEIFISIAAFGRFMNSSADQFDPKETYYLEFGRQDFWTRDGTLFTPSKKYKVAGILLNDYGTMPHDVDNAGNAWGVILSVHEYESLRATEFTPFSYHIALPKAVKDQAKLVNRLDAKNYYYRSDMGMPVFRIYNNLSIFNNIFSIISGFIAVIGMLFICDFMMSNISDRQAEIGILRAMGVRGSDISKTFILQASAVFVVSSVVICILIAVAASFFGPFFESYNVNEERTQLVKLFPSVSNSPLPYIYAETITFGMLAFATLFPTIKLSRMQPIDCIKGSKT